MASQANGTYSGKVAFVTGAGGGIGRAAALAFACEGASVVVADVSEKENQQTARMIEEQGGRALAVRCDVTRVEDVKAALGKTVATFGRPISHSTTRALSPGSLRRPRTTTWTSGIELSPSTFAASFSA